MRNFRVLKKKSLKYKKTYLRTGPSKENKVLWTYKKKGLPLRIMRKRGDWYYVEMADKEKGWVNSSQVSTNRTIIVIAEGLIPLRENPSTNSRIIAKGLSCHCTGQPDIQPVVSLRLLCKSTLQFREG